MLNLPLRRALTACVLVLAALGGAGRAQTPAVEAVSAAPAAPAASAPPAQTASPALTAPTWVQLAAGGVDVSVSHDGQRWYVGSDGRAYRWQEASRSWVVHGSRSDLARIDAGPDGAAALTRDGTLLVTGSGFGDDWRTLAVRAADVAVGGGQLWIVDARLPGGLTGVAQAPFDPSGQAPVWRSESRRLLRIDVDPVGRPWALDAEGRLFRWLSGTWRVDASAPRAVDLAIGGSGAVLLVASDADAQLGGASLHQRDSVGGAWLRLSGRLTAAGIDPEGRVLGVNSRGWVLGSVGRVQPDATVALPAPAASPTAAPAVAAATAVTTLAAVAGSDLVLPEGLAAAEVTRVSGELGAGVFVGETRLNGLKTTVVRYTPAGGRTPTLVIGHATLTLADYVPELAATGVKDTRFDRALFFFVPAGNAGLKPTAADARLINAAFGRAGPNTLDAVAPVGGITFFAQVDPAQNSDLALVGRLFGLGGQPVLVESPRVSPALFSAVVPGAARQAGSATTLAALRARYGEALVASLSLRAAAVALDNARLGPLTLRQPVWAFELDRSASTPALQVSLQARLELQLRAPAATGGVVGTGTETLVIDDARLAVQPRTRAVALQGTLSREGAARIATLRGLNLDTAAVQGALALAAGTTANTPVTLAMLEQLAVEFTARGQLPTARLGVSGVDTDPVPGVTTPGSVRPQVAAGAPLRLDWRVQLALADDKSALVPTVQVGGDLTLAQLSGIDSTATRRVRLREVRWTPGELSGLASLYGLPVRAVRWQVGDSPAIVAFTHQELDLGTYIPAVRSLPNLGSLGLANVVLLSTPDDAPTLTYATREQMPAALAALLDRDRIPDSEIFPLTLRGGTTLIAQYNTRGTADPGLTDRVRAAWGFDDEAYVVKAHFRNSALRNPPFGSFNPRTDGRAVRDVSARDVACAATSAADAQDKAGLDLAFRIPRFKPPYVGEHLQFAGTQFRLREVDGQFEPTVVGSLRIKLPRAQAGLEEIGLAAKLQIQTDLAVLCKGLTPDSNGRVLIAGSTALNTTDVAGRSLAALQRVTTTVATPSTAPAASTSPLGWKRAFGLSFLTINQFALAGELSQSEGRLRLQATVWTDSVLGSESLDALGSLTLEAPATTVGDVSLTDWRLRVPGPVKLTGLPGVARLNAAAPFVELSDLTVSNLSLTPAVLQGDLALPSRQMLGQFLLLREGGTAMDAEAFELYAGVNRLAPNWLLKPEAQLPGAAGAITLGNSLLMLRTAETSSLPVGQLPQAVGRMLDDATGGLLAATDSLPLLRGLGLAGRLSPSEIPAQPAFDNLRAALASMSLTAPMPVVGGVEAAHDGSRRRGFLETQVPRFTVPGLPSGSSAEVHGLRLSLSSVDGRATSGSGRLVYTPPPQLRSLLGTASRTADVQYSYRQQTGGDSVMRLSAQTDIAWPATLSLPGLSFEQLVLDVETQRQGTVLRGSAFTLGADARFLGVEARARLATTRSGPGSAAGLSTSTLVELVARDEGARLDLRGLLGAIGTLLPAGAGAAIAPDTLLRDLTAASLLLAREKDAGTSGRITVAAEDLRGLFNEQAFIGQMAVTGVGQQPVLFLRSDQPLTVGRVFGSLVPTGAFASLGLPEGLVILSPAKASPRLGDVHTRIYGLVFEKLLGAPEAATVFVANEGLTVLSWLDLPEQLPSALGMVAPWLPRSGRLLLAGGLEGGGSQPRRLAFYAEGKGLRLQVPVPLDQVVRSAAGQVLLTFKSVRGGDDAGWETRLSSDAVVRLPNLDRPGTTQDVNATLTLAGSRAAGGDRALTLSAQTDLAWPQAASLPILSMGRLGLQGDVSRSGTAYSSAWMLTADARLNGVAAKARLALNRDGSGSAGGLIELVAEAPGGRLPLAPLLTPLNLLPIGADSRAGPGALFSQLDARGFLLAREAGSGRITVAAEGVAGQLRNQPFAGQLAVVGLTSPQPALFVRSDEPLVLGRVFARLGDLGPLADVALPRGLVIFSPARLSLKLGELPRRIVDAVYDGLYDDPVAAEVLSNEGLTVLARVPLPEGLPAVLRRQVPWLPDAGQLLLGGGLERRADGGSRLALFGRGTGLNLAIPEPLRPVLKSAGGRVLATFKALSGADTAPEASLEASLETDATVVMPRLDTPGTTREVNTALTVTASRTARGDSEVVATAATDLAWPRALSLPNLLVSNFALEARVATQGGVTSSSVALAADARLGSVPARARIGLSAAGGALDGGVFELLATDPARRFDLATVLAPLDLPARYAGVAAPWGYLGSFTARGLLVGRDGSSTRLAVAAEDVRGSLNGQAFEGQFAVVVKDSGPVLFVRSDRALTAADVFPRAVKLGPFGALGLPEAVVMLAPAQGEVNLSELPGRIRDKVFGGYFTEPASARVVANNGLTVLTRLNLGSALPPGMGLLAGWLPDQGRVLVAGGIENLGTTSPTLAFYGSVQGLQLRVPAPLDTFLETVGGQVVLSFKTAGPAGAGAEIGLQTAMKLKAPRLDEAGQTQALDVTLKLSAKSETAAPATLAIAATVDGEWNEPLGFGGFSLRDTTVGIGVSGSSGTQLAISTSRAAFTSGGQTRSFQMDLRTAWVGPAPTQLALQLRKTPDISGDLVLSPPITADLLGRVVGVVFKGGTSLATQMHTRLQQVPGFEAPQGQALTDLASRITAVAASGGGTLSDLVRQTPLAMIGVKNPDLYVVTPGDSLPARPGIEQPPFGLGLRLIGQLVLDAGVAGLNGVNIASGVARMDLRNGWQVSGTLTPPAPFSANVFEVSGSQPLGSMTPNALQLKGRLQLAGSLPAPLSALPTTLDGTFAFRKPLAITQAADVTVNGSVSLGGLAARSASFELRGTSLAVYSAAERCVDVPVALDGTLDLTSFNAAQVLGIVRPGSLGNAVLNCTPGWARDVIAAVDNAVGTVAGTAGAAVGVALSGVEQVPVVGETAAHSARATITAASNSVSTAINAVGFAQGQIVEAILNPTGVPNQALNLARAGYEQASKVFDDAVGALSNLGCTLFSWLPGDHYCRQRERARRRARDAAALAKELALQQMVAAFEAQQQANVEAPFIESEKRRSEEDYTRREVVRLVARNAETERVRAGSTASPAQCRHDQIWNPALRRCVAPEVGLLVDTAATGSPSRCLARVGIAANGVGVQRVTCANDDRQSWRLTADRQLQASLGDGSVDGWGGPWCLARALQNGADRLDMPLVLRACSDPSTRQWQYTAGGQIATASPAVNCLATNGSNQAVLRPCTSVTPPAGQLQWTPALPRDLVGQAGLPRTARLRIGASLCIASDGSYPSTYGLKSCSDNDLDLDFTFGFEDATRFAVQARNGRLCMSSGDYKETTAGERELTPSLCFGLESQQFTLLRGTGSRVLLRNRSSGLCVAAMPATAGAALAAGDAVTEVACNAGDANQGIEMVAVASLVGRNYLAAPAADATSRQQAAIASFRDNLLYRVVRLNDPADAPGGDRCVGPASTGLGVSDPGWPNQALAAAETEACQWLVVVPGRENGLNRVSLAYLSPVAGNWEAGRNDIIEAWRQATVLRIWAPGSAQPTPVFSQVRLNDLAWDQQTSFEMKPGIDGRPNTVSLASIAVPGGYLSRTPDGELAVVVPTTAVARQRATFTVTRRQASGN